MFVISESDAHHTMKLQEVAGLDQSQTAQETQVRWPMLHPEQYRVLIQFQSESLAY